MEDSIDRPKSKVERFKEAARRFFGHKIGKEPITRSASKELPDAGEEEKLDIETLLRVKTTIESLLKDTTLASKESPYVLKGSKEGGMEAMAMAELLDSQEQLRLSSADVGDVVWWKDVADHNGYFIIKKRYNDEPGGLEYGQGVLKVEIDGETVESNKGRISGASFGGMLQPMRITKNVPVEFIIPSEEEGSSSTYITYPVKEMGIIKPEATHVSEATPGR